MTFQQDTDVSSIPGEQGHMQICVTQACDTFRGQVLLEDIAPASHSLEALAPKSLSLFLRSSQTELKKNAKDEPSKTILGRCHFAKDRMAGQEPNRACPLCVGRDKNLQAEKELKKQKQQNAHCILKHHR